MIEDPVQRARIQRAKQLLWAIVSILLTAVATVAAEGLVRYLLTLLP